MLTFFIQESDSEVEGSGNDEFFDANEEDGEGESGEEEEEELTAFEKKALKTDLKQKKIEEESKAEMKTNIAMEEKFVLPSGETMQAYGSIDLSAIHQRIEDVCNFVLFLF